MSRIDVRNGKMTTWPGNLTSMTELKIL